MNKTLRESSHGAAELLAPTADPAYRQPFGSTERWTVSVAKTAEEGLEILAMIGAPGAPQLFIRALRSPIRGIRFTALQNAG